MTEKGVDRFRIRDPAAPKGPCPGPLGGGCNWPWMPLAGPVEPSGSWPRITLVTPSFNQARYIEESLRSVIGQGYPNLEWFVVDGGSTDGSVEIIKRYEPWIDAWVSERDEGQSDALNKGFARATGDIMGWINSDDVLRPGALFAWARGFLANPNCVAVVGRVMNIASDGGELGLFPVRLGGERALSLWSAPGGALLGQPGCLFRRSALDPGDVVRRDLHYVMDVELWIRLARAGAFAEIPEVVACNRVHSEAKTFKDVPAREFEHLGMLVGHGSKELAQQRFRASFAEIILADGDLETFLRPFPAKLLLGHLASRVIGGMRRRLFGGRQPQAPID